jgi:hypothetical protein
MIGCESQKVYLIGHNGWQVLYPIPNDNHPHGLVEPVNLEFTGASLVPAGLASSERCIGS